MNNTEELKPLDKENTEVYEELLDCATDFYNLTMGNNQVKISCLDKNTAMRVEISGVRLRNCLRTMLQLQRLDNEARISNT